MFSGGHKSDKERYPSHDTPTTSAGWTKQVLYKPYAYISPTLTT